MVIPGPFMASMDAPGSARTGPADISLGPKTGLEL